jgi:hypothetical protein
MGRMARGSYKPEDWEVGMIEDGKGRPDKALGKSRCRAKHPPLPKAGSDQDLREEHRFVGYVQYYYIGVDGAEEKTRRSSERSKRQRDRRRSLNGRLKTVPPI